MWSFVSVCYQSMSQTHIQATNIIAHLHLSAASGNKMRNRGKKMRIHSNLFFFLLWKAELLKGFYFYPSTSHRTSSSTIYHLLSETVEILLFFTSCLRCTWTSQTDVDRDCKPHVLPHVSTEWSQLTHIWNTLILVALKGEVVVGDMDTSYIQSYQSHMHSW